MSKFAPISVTMQEEVEYILYSLAGEPTLVLKQAGEINKPYFNALLRRSRKNMPRIKSGNIDADLVAANRQNDRELYANHVLVGWKGIKDTDGKNVPFTAADALDFLNQLPNFIFDEIRDFATEPRNFVKDEEGPEVAEVAGNLPSA